jgi:hypothetical protein
MPPSLEFDGVDHRDRNARLLNACRDLVVCPGALDLSFRAKVLRERANDAHLRAFLAPSGCEAARLLGQLAVIFLGALIRMLVECATQAARAQAPL